MREWAELSPQQLTAVTPTAVVLVCDFTNLSTLTHAAQWLQDAQDANPASGHDMMVMLVVNKRDMVVSGPSGTIDLAIG